MTGALRMSAALVTLALMQVPAAFASPVTEVHYVMGTYFRITADSADDAGARAALRGCFAETRQMDARFSRFDPHSELTHLNESSAASGEVAVSAEMAALLRRALALRAATDGAFDVSIGALTDLWRTAQRWPSQARIDVLRSRPGTLVLGARRLRRQSGVRIDLDGIAKGWAVDRCVDRLRAAGIRTAFLSFGESSLYALGAPTDRHGWPVEVRSLDTDRALGVLTMRDEAVSVSAVFGHEHQVGNRRVGHIVDPRTGRPLTSPAMAVVVAPSATDAEAFSKALLIDASESVRHHRAHTLNDSCTGGTASGSLREGLASGRISGALLVTPDATRRSGRLRFKPLTPPPPITAAAEPLR